MSHAGVLFVHDTAQRLMVFSSDCLRVVFFLSLVQRPSIIPKSLSLRKRPLLINTVSPHVHSELKG